MTAATRRHAARVRHRELEPVRYLAWMVGLPLAALLRRYQTSDRPWHDLACRIGDWFDKVTSLIATVIACAFVLAALIAAVAYAPVAVSGGVIAAAGLVVVVVRRLRVASRTVDQIRTEKLPRVDIDATVQMPAVVAWPPRDGDDR